jgi:hypothetical protein
MIFLAQGFDFFVNKPCVDDKRISQPGTRFRKAGEAASSRDKLQYFVGHSESLKPRDPALDSPSLQHACNLFLILFLMVTIVAHPHTRHLRTGSIFYLHHGDKRLPHPEWRSKWFTQHICNEWISSHGS